MSLYDLALQAVQARRARLGELVVDPWTELKTELDAIPPPELAASLQESPEGVLELRVPFLDVTLFLVSSEREALPLLEEGISRGRIWTLNELTDLYTIPDLMPHHRMTLVTVCALFDGEIVSAKKAKEAQEAPLTSLGSEESEVRGKGGSEGE